VIGAEKHDAGSAFPSFSGWVDEVRLSNVVRYTASFTRPGAAFSSDASTVALYHLDEGPAGPCTGTVLDGSGAAGGPSNGTCSFGGTSPAGPVYTTDTAPLSPPECGDGGPDPGEECDDGDLEDGDGCDSNCTFTACGNGIVTAGEACDDGNTTAGDGCEPDCTLTTYRLLSGQNLSVRDKGGDPARRRLLVVSRDAGIVAPAPGSASDPRAQGATLRLARGTAEVDSYVLPPSGWRGLGVPNGSQGYRYSDRLRTNGPCRIVLVRPGRLLRASCLGSQMAFTLDEPSQGALTVTFRPGTSGVRSCFLFGGTIAKDSQALPGIVGRFRARRAGPPASCPLP
jgi:cysteine-rich repeat protein